MNSENKATDFAKTDPVASRLDAHRDAFEMAYATEWHRERARANETPAELAADIKNWRNGITYDDDLPRLKHAWEGYQWAIKAIPAYVHAVERDAFEAFMRLDTSGYSLERDNLSYKEFDVALFWHFWQARAALAYPAAAVAFPTEGA